MNAPLAGVRVVDFSELLPGPFFTQSLVELGADVLKIERPPHGDNLRRLAPGVFASVNRGKRSLLADLKDADEARRMADIASAADIVVESYRPGVMGRLGLDYARLCARNPRLIYVSLTGYGQTGPDAMLPGHDLNYLAASGSLALSGRVGGPVEQTFGLPVADLGGAMAALSATLAALYQREHSGRGQHLDVSLTDTIVHWMNPRLGHFSQLGVTERGEQRRLARERAAYGTFTCRDGREITIAALEDHFWKRLVRALPLGPCDDPLFDDHRRRGAEAASINRVIAEVLAGMDSDEAVRRLIEADVPVMPVLAPLELAAHPQFAHRALIADTEAGPFCRFPVSLEGMSPLPRETTRLAASREMPGGTDGSVGAASSPAA